MQPPWNPLAGASPAAPRDVLVIADDHGVLQDIRRALSGLPVRVLGDGGHAVCTVGEADVAVVVLDLRHDDRSAVDAVGEARARADAKHAWILLLVATPLAPELVDRLEAAGGVDHEVEPIDLASLRSRIRTLLQLQVAARSSMRAAQLRGRVDRMTARIEELQVRLLRQLVCEADLVAANEDKDEVMARVAHELRNPLAAMTLGLRELGARCGAGPAASATLETIDRHVAVLRRLVDDLGDGARIGTDRLRLRPARTELARVVGHARALCQPELDARSQHLVVDGDGRPVPLVVDEIRLTQVVANLLCNASRYSPVGASIRLHWGRDGDDAVVQVTDEGDGIAPEFVPHLFDSYAREHPGGDGLGLGLAIVREIVEAHDGTVHATSEGKGRGSQFVVRLPREREADVVRPRSPRRPSGPHPMASRRIVLVEDHIDIQQLLVAVIGSWGHTVVAVAGAGREAIERITALRPDVAIIDLGLPDIDGRTVATEVRARLGDAPPRLIAMSGFEPEPADGADVVAFDGYLTKPPDLADLRRLLCIRA